MTAAGAPRCTKYRPVAVGDRPLGRGSAGEALDDVVALLVEACRRQGRAELVMSLVARDDGALDLELGGHHPSGSRQRRCGCCLSRLYQHLGLELRRTTRPRRCRDGITARGESTCPRRDLHTNHTPRSSSCVA